MKDNEDLKISKDEFIREIKKFKRQEIKNTEVEVKKYSLWQRILKVLGMN
jgi:hypothetical protein